MNNESPSIEMHFNKDVLFNKLGRNPTFFNELLELAIKDLVNLKSLLLEYYNAKREAKILIVSHRLKGTSASVNLPLLRKYVYELEDTDFSDIENFDKSIDKICKEIDFLIKHELVKI